MHPAVQVPHYYDTVNYLRVATYAATFFTSVMMVLIVFKPGVNKHDLEAVQNWREDITIATYAGLPVAALLGGLAAWLRLWWFRTKALPRFQ